MDVDKMKDDMLEKMAEAVENADVFLMAMSAKYKQSVACRFATRWFSFKSIKNLPNSHYKVFLDERNLHERKLKRMWLFKGF